MNSHSFVSWEEFTKKTKKYYLESTKIKYEYTFNQKTKEKTLF